jgi:hypothetical protein
MINVDQALLWVTWAFFSGGVLGLFAGAALSYAARLEERAPVVIGEPLTSSSTPAAPSAETVRQRRGQA